MALFRKVWLVDDDKIYRYASTRYIKEADPTIEVRAFEESQDALDELRGMTDEDERLPGLILLDVNMPIIDGWDFMNEYEQLSAQKRENISIYIVSSSIDENDMERAAANPDVSRYITKPVMQEDFKKLLKISPKK